MTDPGDRIESLFGSALEVEPGERRAFVAREAGDDAELAREVLSLLDARDARPDFLAGSAHRTPAFPARATAGTRVGPYRLVRPIGAGGMGSVWLGERADGTYRAAVAVKLIHPELLVGARRDEVLRRFAAERQTLSDLDHPAIARLLDGGATEDGTPWLAMEYVDGQPLDRYCEEQRLARDERLRLFVQVCRAVQYAHGRLVAHRDLKPGNVLVRRGADGASEPKLLDFGIARIFGGDDGDALRTTVGSARLTPAYASPEQFRGEPATAQSDVWSLGVMLFELLTGRLPFDVEGASLPVVAQAVVGGQPLRAGALDRRLRGDLDTILAKALEQQAERRYASAAQLAEDVERHLEGQPILARPATRLERFTKSVRRNPLSYGLAAGLFLSISALSVWLFVLERRSVVLAETAQSAEKRADGRREHAERTSEILRQLLVAPNPFAKHGRDARVVDVLDDSAPRALAGLDGQPEVRCELSRLVDETYRALGAYEKAEPHARQSYEDTVRVHGAHSAEALMAASNLATVDVKLGRLVEAEERMRDVVASAIELLGPEDERTLLFRTNLGGILRETNRPEEAEEHARAAFEGDLALFGAADRRTLGARNTVVSVLSDQGRWSEAVDLAREGLADEERMDPRAPDVRLFLEFQLGYALGRLGALGEAESVLSAAHAERAATLGPEHPDTLDIEVFLRDVQIQLGRAEAEADLERCILAYEHGGERNCQSLVYAYILRCEILLQRGEFDAAMAVAQAAWNLGDERLGRRHWLTINALTRMWMVALESGDLPLAAQWLRENLELLVEVHGPQHRDVLAARGNMAVILYRQKRLVEADEMLRELLADFEAVGMGETPEFVTYAYNLGLVLQARGQLDEAEDVLCRALELSCRALGEDNLNSAWVEAAQARVLAEAGRMDAAAAAFQGALARFRHALPPGHPRTLRHLREAAEFYESRGESENAEPLRREIAEAASGS